jgi:hypothetical protein
VTHQMSGTRPWRAPMTHTCVGTSASMSSRTTPEIVVPWALQQPFGQSSPFARSEF